MGAGAGMIETGPDGAAYVRLHVKPGASREAVVGEHGGALKVAVTAPPERGRANEAAEALLARVLGLKRRAVAIVAGATSREKRALVSGLSPDEVKARLLALLGGRNAGCRKSGS